MLKIVENFKLPKEFKSEPNLNLLAQAVHIYEERSHIGLRNTKTRSEINRTTKKVYKQKGTGGARHGSRRANVFVGGGVVFGPRPKRRLLKLSKLLKSLSKRQALSLKASQKEVIVVSGIGKITKTRQAAEFLKTVEKETKAKRFTILLSDGSLGSLRCLNNLNNLRAVKYKDANAFDIWNGGMLLIDEEVFEISKVGVKPSGKVTKKTK